MKILKREAMFATWAGRPGLRDSGLRRRRCFAAFGSFLGMLILGLGSARATIINAASVSQSDVAAAIASANNGDTVVIPTGTAAWTGALSISKAITLRGSGVGKTIIKDGVASNKELVLWGLVPGKQSRMTGIEFQDGGRTATAYNGVIKIDGGNNSNNNGQTMRIDNCKFDHLKGDNIDPSDMIGVIDHNTFLLGAPNIGIYSRQGKWNGQGINGDGSYAAPSNFGSDRFLFIEDNTFTRDANSFYALIDGSSATRWVARYNTFHNGWLELHGTDSGNRNRGSRACEIYNNTFTCDNITKTFIANFRSGVGVIHNNTITGMGSSPGAILAVYRTQASYAVWGIADGTNQWDKNVAGGPFYSGTVLNSGLLTATVSGSPWSTNQWADYSIKRTFSASGASASQIISNTANTITFGSISPNISAPLSFADGGTFEIWKIDQAIDQPGRSGGSLISGNPPVKPSGWNDQITEPLYQWNNTVTGGGTFSFRRGSGSIRPNEHFFNDKIKPGYKSYTYPHPLVTGTPAAPANVRIGASN